MPSFEENLKKVNEAEVVDVCVRSHTGGRYWDELAISINPKFERDNDGPYRFRDEFEHFLPDHVREMEDEYDQLQSPEFGAMVRHWAKGRLDEVKGYLDEVWNGRETIKVSRSMIVSSAWLRELGDVSGESIPVSRFGYFWSAEDGRPDSYFADPDQKGVEIMITAEVSPEAVDYRTTLLARMDYMNADDEGEIRLLKDAVVLVKEVAIYKSTETLDVGGEAPQPAFG